MKKNTPLKIGLIVDDGMDRLDGVQKFVVTIGEYFRSKGHSVHYLAGQTKRKDLENLHSLSKNLKVVFNGGNQLSIPLPASSSKLKELLAKENFDVLHVQMPYSPFLAGKIIRLTPKETPIVGSFHILPYSRFHYFGSQLLGFIQRRTLSKFDYIYSVSEPAQKFAENAFKIKTQVLPNPVNVRDFRSENISEAKDTVSIVYLGRLVRRKGCHELLRVIDYIEKNSLTSINYHLDILSDGAMREKLEKFVSDHKLENKVSFRGYVDDRQKAKYLNKADIAVFPSLGGESFGIVLVEAIAAGASVVLVGNNPGYRSVIKNNDLVVEPTETESFAKKLATYINDPSLRKKVKKELSEQLGQYDVEVVGDTLIAKYYELQK